jgi:hypothetical protein
MLRALLLATCAIAAATQCASAQTITVMVAPFDGSKSNSEEVGKRVGIILNLQIWRTLIVPTSGAGAKTHGAVTWDVSSRPPTNAPEAEELAGRQREDPQIVLWGRAWQYGHGNVVEAFLSIRDSANADKSGPELWKVDLDENQELVADFPHRQLDFAPIVLRADLMPELTDPAGLKLYVAPRGEATNGFVGDNFTAISPSGDSEEVVLPDRRRGWVRLPSLSRDRNEVVDFTAALVRIMRRDWPNAGALFRRVVEDNNVPTLVRIDSYLYLAIGAAHQGEDPIAWIRKAYELDPYSKTIIQYLCMGYLAELRRMSEGERSGDKGAGQIQLVRDTINRNRALFSENDPWIAKVSRFLERNGGKTTATRAAANVRVAPPGRTGTR